MSIWIMIFRKMVKNRWLVFSLLIGMILCTSVTSSLPIYTDAILKRMLIQEMDRAYENSGQHPARIHASINMTSIEMQEQGEVIAELDQYWKKNAMQAEGLDPLLFYLKMETYGFNLEPIDSSRVDITTNRRVTLLSRTDLLDHVRLVDGRLPSPEIVDGRLEVVVTDQTLAQLDTVLGHEFVVDSESERFVNETMRVVPVGVIAEADLQDLYWNATSLQSYERKLIVDEQIFTDHFLGNEQMIKIYQSLWYTTYDYSHFDLARADTAMRIYEQLDQKFAKVYFPLSQTIEDYREQEDQLKRLLWSLNVPMYLLIAFYLYVVSNLIVNRQRSEMAVLRSRGGTRLQIVAIYAMEALIYAVIAGLIGPWIGKFFTGVLGSTDTFMSFVQRSALDVEVNAESLTYSCIAAAAAFILMLIPVILATHSGILDQKRQAAREGRGGSPWHKFGLDFIFLGLSFYGLFLFRRQVKDMIDHGLGGGSLSVDPLLFAIPSLFVLGFGLLILRVYPHVVQLIYRLGKSRWSPGIYSMLLLISRRGSQYHALLLFLILTVGTGLFNASAARTLNQNIESQIWYEHGSDIVLEQIWPNNAPSANEYDAMGSPDAPEVISYREPPFELFEDLPGVASSARVFIKEEAGIWTGADYAKARLVAIDTDDFGNTAWMKDGLLDHHFFEYLNMLASDPYAVLVSQSIANAFDIEVGDFIDAGWPEAGRAPFRVYGIIDYFPSFNPNPPAASQDTPMLIVAHLETVQANLRVEPYQVWLRLTDQGDRQALFDAFSENRIFIASLNDAYRQVNESRSDPFRIAMNGMLSLGFILSLCICFFGFMLYWVLALQGRMLQLGIYRAMGISFKQLIGMLGFEQWLTSGAGFIIGMSSGAVAGILFVPLFQIAFDPGKVVPPFEVVFQTQDAAQLLILIGIMLVMALSFLIWLLRKMKIAQVVKLGED